MSAIDKLCQDVALTTVTHCGLVSVTRCRTSALISSTANSTTPNDVSLSRQSVHSYYCHYSLLVVNEKQRERRAPKAPRWVGYGVASPSLVWEGHGRGPCPLPRKFFDFLSGNGAFWCILGACSNVSIRRVKQSRKAVLCANCQ